MLTKEGCMDIWSLDRQGYSHRAIARRLGIDRRTVKKYLESKAFPRYTTGKRGSGLAPYHQMIRDWLKEDDFRATRIHEMVIAQGYQGSYETVKRFVRQVKEARDRVAYIRFETVPGLQAQVDFGDFKVRDAGGTDTTLYAFVMVLGFSRHMYVEFIERCTMTGFLDCHKHAFGYFRGVPGEILYDNMKNVVVRRLVGQVKFNETFVDFGRHYGFKAAACPPYSPWYKGKVERPISYIRERFWRGYGFVELERANRDVCFWLDTVATRRVHGTTRQKVRERFEMERPHLGTIPRRPFDTSEKVVRKVYKDCQVSFEGNRYVVPHRYVGKDVVLKVKGGIVRFFHDDLCLVTYRIPEGKGQVNAHPWLYEALKRDVEQLVRKYRTPARKGKATRGLLKNGLRHELVQQRPLSEYDRLIEGGDHV
jgi:transposase